MKKLSTREIAMLVVLGFVAAIAGFYLLLWQPMQQKITETAADIEALGQTLIVTQTNLAEASKIQSGISENEEYWAEIEAKLPEGFLDIDIISMMADARKKYNIEPVDLGYSFESVETVREDVLMLTNVNITLTGKYSTIMDFIDYFVDNKNIVCRVVNYSSAISTESGAASDAIRSSFTLQMFYRVPKTDSTPEVS